MAERGTSGEEISIEGLRERREGRGSEEELSVEQLKGLLHSWANALDESTDYEFELGGKSCTIPFEAVRDGRVHAEYAAKQRDFEFELKIKWTRH